MGQIDLLVQEGFYANRAGLIRTAVRNRIAQHGETLRQVISRKTLVPGIQQHSVADLEAAVDSGGQLDIRVLGLVVFADDVTAELATAAVGSLTVLGAMHAPSAVKTALRSRLH